jgi:hypothetical protein
MALRSATSTGYCSSHVLAWKNSQYGLSPLYIALVEVANSSRVHQHANGIVVAADEYCVMLRYLFVYGAPLPESGTPVPTLPNKPRVAVGGYANGTIPNVEAKSLAGSRYRNTTTIAYGATYEEVVAAGTLITTDNDTYFWDIEELVQMIQSKHGLFINGYNHLPFSPADTSKILAHPMAVPLKAMEAENTALRKHIPASVLTHLNSVGWICKNDNSEEMERANNAVAELRTWLEKLDKRTRDALEHVPFSARDSHTHQPMRNTITHAVELVSSGGECIHRFGDFLSQVC